MLNIETVKTENYKGKKKTHVISSSRNKMYVLHDLQKYFYVLGNISMSNIFLK